MLIPFAKMQAQGNDFAILELVSNSEMGLDLPRLAVDICDRRKGVGADGLVLLLSSKDADAGMIIYNSDGSRAAMCGSALRCCAFLLHGYNGKRELAVHTDSGMKTARILEQNGETAIEVNLGQPSMLAQSMEVEGLKGSLVDVGNLHFVVFCQALDGQELRLGPILENHPDFPGGVNSQFVRIVSPEIMEMRIWERGAGATQACGTGAVASVFAGMGLGLLGEQVTVQMPGGKVCVRALERGEYILGGAVEHSFNGVFRWKI